MSRKYDNSIKLEVCEKLRNGEKLSDVSSHYGIAKSTISGWLKRSAVGEKGEELEIGKLKRENEALYKLLGRLTYEGELKKKRESR